MILASNYLVPLEKNKDLEKMRGYINELIMSFTGRLDVDTYDLFSPGINRVAFKRNRIVL